MINIFHVSNDFHDYHLVIAEQSVDMCKFCLSKCCLFPEMPYIGRKMYIIFRLLEQTITQLFAQSTGDCEKSLKCT